MQLEALDVGDLKRWAKTPELAGRAAPLADFTDEIITYLERDLTTYGDPLPWQKTHGLFRLRPHEATLWAGENGSWKSTVLSQVLLHQAVLGRRVMLASLEMTAAQVGAKLVQQACGVANPGRKAIADFLASTRDKLIVCDVQGQVSIADALALLRWAAIERKCAHIALDNMTKIVSASNEAAGEQQQFANDTHGIALATGAHIHVVAHLRKPNGISKPSRYDIRGSSTISDQFDNALIFWRNRPKEEAFENRHASDQAAEDWDRTRAEPDLVVRVDKQRHAPWQGSFKFWQHVHSQQFLPDTTTPPIPYAFEHQGAH